MLTEYVYLHTLTSQSVKGFSCGMKTYRYRPTTFGAQVTVTVTPAPGAPSNCPHRGRFGRELASATGGLSLLTATMKSDRRSAGKHRTLTEYLHDSMKPGSSP